MKKQIIIVGIIVIIILLVVVGLRFFNVFDPDENDRQKIIGTWRVTSGNITNLMNVTFIRNDSNPSGGDVKVNRLYDGKWGIEGHGQIIFFCFTNETNYITFDFIYTFTNDYNTLTFRGYYQNLYGNVTKVSGLYTRQ